MLLIHIIRYLNTDECDDIITTYYFNSLFFFLLNSYIVNQGLTIYDIFGVL